MICKRCNKNEAVWDDKRQAWIVCNECLETGKKEIEMMQQEERMKYIEEDLYFSSGIPKRFLKAKLEDFPNISKIDYKKKEGFLVTGHSGAGKTHFLCAYARYLVYHQVSVKFVNFPSMMVELKGNFDSDIIKQCIDAEHLMIDDLGAEKQSEWQYEQLYHIINTRYNEMLPFSVSLNGKVEDVSDLRIVRRLTESCVTVEL